MKEIMRKCASCSEIQDRVLMHRIVFSKKDELCYLNPNSKIVGYSVYICHKPSCIKDFLKKKRIRKCSKKFVIKNIEEVENKLLSLIE